MTQAGYGKSKGSQWEREVCKDLSLWISHGHRDDLLWRSAMSGGRASVHFKKGKAQRAQEGDISSIDVLSHPFTDIACIECKFWKSLDITPSLLQGRGHLAQFWREVCKVADRCGKEPILFARQNRLPPLVLMTPGLVSRLQLIWRPLLVSHVMPPGDVFVYWYKEFISVKYVLDA